MSFSEFYQRSINEPEQFWAEQARRIDWQTPFTQTLDHSNPPFARWFCEGRTNLCHNAIDRWLEKQPEALALIAVSSETEEERTFTFRQLHDEVNAVASMLRSLGVQRGDRVLVYMPMIAEAHITLLACARIGAIHSVVFGGFASHSVAARIDDAKPVLIVSADAGARGGKIIPYKKLLDDAISQAQHQPRHVLLVDRGLAKMARVSGRDVDFASLRHQHIGARVPVAWLESNETSCILYTSGTTGKPKGVQRDVGGYAVALATSMDTIFGGKAGGVFFCASKRSMALLLFGYRLGGGAFVYRLRAAAGGDGDYRLRRIADLAGLRRVVENRREISGEPNVLSANRHSRAEKIPYRRNSQTRSLVAGSALSGGGAAGRANRQLGEQYAGCAGHRQLLADRIRLADYGDCSRSGRQADASG